MAFCCQPSMTGTPSRRCSTGRVLPTTTRRWISSLASRPLRPDIHELQELHTCAGVLAERARHAAGNHRHATLVYTPRGHALVSCVDNDTNTAWFEHIVDAVGDLGCQFLLYLEAPGITLDHSCQLADPNYLVGRQITDVRPPDDGRHVVLAV